MIFADALGVNPTQWGNSPYDDIITKLIAAGVPADQIAAMGDAESDAKKQALFEKVRQGSVRVLIGSTQKMGTGTNVQKRLVALHHPRRAPPEASGSRAARRSAFSARAGQ